MHLVSQGFLFCKYVLILGVLFIAHAVSRAVMDPAGAVDEDAICEFLEKSICF